jgi:hypothetical protein
MHYQGMTQDENYRELVMHPVLCGRVVRMIGTFVR